MSRAPPEGAGRPQKEQIRYHTNITVFSTPVSLRNFHLKTNNAPTARAGSIYRQIACALPRSFKPTKNSPSLSRCDRTIPEVCIYFTPGGLCRLMELRFLTFAPPPTPYVVPRGAVQMAKVESNHCRHYRSLKSE
nr:hypothetical protein BgiMline_009769 [Biomphalaria glabrata]